MTVAVAVTVFGFGTVAGALYNPVDAPMVPPPEVIVQVTGPVTLVRVVLNWNCVPMITGSVGPVMVMVCAEAARAHEARVKSSSFDCFIIRFLLNVPVTDISVGVQGTPQSYVGKWSWARGM